MYKQYQINEANEYTGVWYIQVSEYPLMSLEPDDRGTLLAVGAENGDTIILELSHHLIDLQRNEKNLFLGV